MPKSRQQKRREAREGRKNATGVAVVEEDGTVILFENPNKKLVRWLQQQELYFEFFFFPSSRITQEDVAEIIERSKHNV